MPWRDSFLYWAPGWLFVILCLLFFVWAVATFFLPFLVWGIFRRTGEIERELRRVTYHLGKINALQQESFQARKTEAGGEPSNRDEAITL